MTGQDWLEKDFYAVLGVPKDADATTIKKAYRKLARSMHPDHNPGDASAEAKFKEIGEAYAVLSDTEQRQQYDQLRAMAGGARFTAGGRGGGTAGFEDLFGGMFGGANGPGGRVRYTTSGSGAPAGFEDLLGGLFNQGGGFGGARGPQPGADLVAEVTLPFRQATEGSTVSLTVDGKTVNARIPPGVRDGQKIRLRGKGRTGDVGAPAGDLVITVHVTPHPVFSADGPHLRITVPVAFDEAALGATVEVPTLDGGTVKVRVPEGTPSGRVLRVKGKGITTGSTTGDLLVTVQVVVPQRLSAAAREAVQAFGIATSGEDVRADLIQSARK
ncbi:DnaJ C-terminal domain-containing protein [Cellulomonas fimi]|uniref:Chaperone DnaJ domain protein n=1 Tax=Cellulomonas fimi (strain ATCC 484 / DSM 20113 / JCM 1341 / CCUG 24087 / LMG 16345 / NBRC 15513 / NCIMB 8980 / NCTC 7547 / NRS-133) TaxID=590998 RepID=F4H7P3_CELFA|nr:DnaJ C-terminal domain-containing protein [Cellulomonas fimi]AEE44600.1 chaperone DnaJ domain protein [Cellulomonas fimi ATCC 484]NNH09039.1 DnaJ domain-containing protein [Cellulomonas fimi]VEH26745.1 Curved DNA-binding protein [Cellulomonas fimi]